MATVEARPARPRNSDKTRLQGQDDGQDEARPSKIDRHGGQNNATMNTRSARKRAMSSSAAYQAHTGYDGRDEVAVASSSRERALQAELEIVKRQVSFLPFLKEKFDALVKEHADSKARYTSKTDVLRQQVQELEKNLKETQSEAERYRAEILAKTSEVRTLGNELGRLRSAKGEVEQQLKESERIQQEEQEQCQALAGELLEQRSLQKEASLVRNNQNAILGQHANALITSNWSEHDAANKRLESQLLVSTLSKLKLARKIEEKDDQVCQLVELILQSEEEQAWSEERIEDLEDDFELLERLRSSDERLFRSERRHLQEQVENLSDDLRTLQHIYADKEAEWRHERKMLKTEIKTAVSIIDSQEAALAELQNISMANFQLELNLRQKIVESEEAFKTITARDEEIGSLKKHSEILAEEKEGLSDNLAAAQDALHATEQELNNERAQRRHLSSLLIQSQATETQLQDELFSLQNDLVSYLQLQETHADLIKNLDRLMRTADLAEEDAKELARMNSELAGHNNPNQRIRQLDRLRNELAELKKKFVTAQADLAAHKGKIAALESEVASYKSIDEQRPKLIKHVQALTTSTNIARNEPLGNAGFGHVSVRKNNMQQVNAAKAATVFGQKAPVRSFLS